MTADKKFVLEEFLDELPVHFHQLRKRQMEDATTVKLVSSKNYATNAMYCYLPHKPISRILKDNDEKNP
jgi:hypothetical protein